MLMPIHKVIIVFGVCSSFFTSINDYLEVYDNLCMPEWLREIRLNHFFCQ